MLRVIKVSRFDLNERSTDIFKRVVEAYVETGEPVGSRSLSKLLETRLSPATIRNVMADLEEAGLLYAPHTSAGRLPTEAGLRYFINGMLEITDLPTDIKDDLEQKCRDKGVSYQALLEEASNALSGLTQCATLVMVPKEEARLKHLEFVPLSPTRALVVLVTDSGMVENRIIETPVGLSQSLLIEAGNYLSSRIQGRTLSEAKSLILSELENKQQVLDQLASGIIRQGLAVWGGGEKERSLIVRGQGHLLSSIQQRDDIEKIQQLFYSLEKKEGVVDLLDAALRGDGVQIFIGSEHPLFTYSECSMVIAPYKTGENKIIGAIGVLGPKRINYGKVIPLVNYTAKILGRLLDLNGEKND